MKIEYREAMPSHLTFTIKPISQLLDQYTFGTGKWLDPFANRNHSYADETNDINPNSDTDFNLCASEYLDVILSNPGDYENANFLYDPPYSLRQLKEVYEGIGHSLTQHDTQYFFSELKNKIAFAIPLGGYCISFGWNSTGLGRKRGFKKIQLLIVNHWGQHNDTICLVEQRVQDVLF